MDWVRDSWFVFIPVVGIVFLGVYIFARSMQYNRLNHAEMLERRKDEQTKRHGCH